MRVTKSRIYGDNVKREAVRRGPLIREAWEFIISFGASQVVALVAIPLL